MKKISLYLAFGISVVAGVIGIGIGYALTPEYQISMYNKSNMDLGPADRNYDLRYVNAMIAHHTGAMLLAEQLQKNTERPEMKNLADAILNDEPAAIAELYAWKKDWYNDRRKVPDPAVPNLGVADETFDLRFLNAMIAHHEAGLEMTEDAIVKSSRTEVLKNAYAVDEFLSNGITALTSMRAAWYSK